MIATPFNVETIRMPAPLTHAFVVDSHSRLMFVSGLTARGADGKTVAPHDPGAQADYILSTIARILAAAGGSISDVIKLTIFLADRQYAPLVGKVRAQYFPSPPYPASTMIEARLMSDDQLIEIEAIAVLPDESQGPGKVVADVTGVTDVGSACRA